MRQNDGSELFGSRDPRNSALGIIHVSPNDDRQSVITAIATQEKLGRSQIVLDLPAQNKSFKTDIDFVGLHKMADDLESNLILIIPKKSRIAHFARKEGFTQFPSMEEFVASEFPPIQADEPASLGDLEPAVNETEAPLLDEDESDRTLVFPVNPSLLFDKPEPEASVAPPLQPPLLFDKPEPETSVAPPLQPPLPDDKPEPEAIAAPVPQETAPVSAQPADPGETQEGDRGLSDIAESSTDLPNWATNRQPPVVPQQRVEIEQNTTPQQQSIVPMGGFHRVSNALVPTGSLPPAYPQVNPSYLLPHRRRSWTTWLIAAIIVVLLVGLILLLYRPVLDLIFPPTATVTITPRSQLLKHTYPITAVLGNADPAQNQVKARLLYAPSQTQSQTAKASGLGSLPGQQAQGVLTFYNVSISPQIVAAGTVITDGQGIAVVNDDTITLPAYTSSQNGVSVKDEVHTLNQGSKQNIPANDFNQTPCCGGVVYVSNARAFTGGQDPGSYNYVQQSDIDAVAGELEASLSHQAMTALETQIQANEHLVNTPLCEPQVRSNHHAGDQVSIVTVSVTESCEAEVYNREDAQRLAVNELALAASKEPGPDYLPTGDITATIVQASTTGGTYTVMLSVNTQGVWVYQFTDSQRVALVKLIAGKSNEQARTTLLGQPGVSSVTLMLSNATGERVLPENVHNITISVEAVQGLS